MMEQFLRASRTILRDSSKLIHAVLGNGTCDLDSAMCSLVYAYYLNCSGGSVNAVHHVPVLNVRRDRYSLLTDVQHILSQCGLSDSTLLTFRDDIDLESLCKRGLLQLTLVDCHVLPPPDNSLDACVVDVIDHRPRAQPDRPNVPTTIELVGSCCTLVAEKLLTNKFSIPPAAVSMLYSAIIYDTVCLSDSAGRKTAKDEAVIAQLQRLQPSLDRQKLFTELKKIKQDDVSKLSSADLLRRDLKTLSSAGFHIAVPAIVCDMQAFLQRPQLGSDLIAFADEHHSAAIIMMFLHTVGSEGDIVREMAIYSQNEGLRQLIFKTLSEATNPSLQLSEVRLPDVAGEIIACNQGNVKPSRKAVLPIVQTHLELFKEYKCKT